MIFSHKPVLLKEVIEYLNPEKGKKYIDATLGGGGYSFEILKKGGKVLGIDQDEDAIGFVRKRWDEESKKYNLNKENLVLVKGNFKDIQKIAHLNNFEKVSGIVFDLGLSSYQIEESGRGFSFLRDEPLDMRMDKSLKTTAADIVNTWNEEELYELFSKMGEESFSRAISNNIIRARRVAPLKSSLELAKIVVESIPEKRKIHPATKVFQALRIVVNDELGSLKTGLKDGFELLDGSGRMIVVSFHSLEDRIVKNTFKEIKQANKGKIITKKPITASDIEIKENVRARSAKMRVIEKVI